MHVMFMPPLEISRNKTQLLGIHGDKYMRDVNINYLLAMLVTISY